ncbi:MAG: HigA family addiction module antitoxin [Maricaulis sp.]|jgi:addiction module HigA family antidote|nr:HigA family addiction module antitoxin [Maricaulis sp.]
MRIKTHPGDVLREDFLKPFGISINKLARDLDVPVSRISEIVNKKRDITPDTAYRLARYFGTTPKLWMNLQTAHSLSVYEANEAARVMPTIRMMDPALITAANG